MQPPQQHGQPPQQGRPPQQGQPGGGWGQQPGQQPGQPQGQPGGGWGQPPQQGGAYQQQGWGQRPPQQGGWQPQGSGQWQPTGPGGPGGRDKGPFGISKDKLPFFIGGGVVGLIVIALLVFLGIRAFSGDDDTPTSQPTSGQSTQGGDPSTSTSPSTGTGPGTGGQLGNATGQAKGITDKLQGMGFGCSDLFNTGQGAHRGCFKYDGSKQADAIFQFKSDGTIIAVRLETTDDDNNNNAQVAFGQVLQAVGNDTFGGDSVTKVQDSVKTGQRSDEVSTGWGEFQLSNSGSSLRLSGHKNGEESLDLPDQTFDTTAAQMTTALKAKSYVCTTSCRKDVGEYGSQRVFFYASAGKGIKDLELSVSADGSAVKTAMKSVLGDAFGVLQGGNAAAVKAYVEAHTDGKQYAAYVGGWKVEIDGDSSGSYGSQRVSIEYETFYA
ncbi:hypothetical protein GCM10009630_45220 [Kribbella jejuensis]|uniref:Uncharacterized protein n=1 Tax=Kribbella jejuensis TaxID=236068 RepID=A0A542EMS4_9ACTN|nr:hypothetical protein [Kribbella jejuensis]TQJ16648.1 hypothetical protein FB475_0753 [Kribbella jejuensis]